MRGQEARHQQQCEKLHLYNSPEKRWLRSPPAALVVRLSGPFCPAYEKDTSDGLQFPVPLHEP
eukprot:7690496-Pyramimonas_sp.AAC.1